MKLCILCCHIFYLLVSSSVLLKKRNTSLRYLGEDSKAYNGTLTKIYTYLSYKIEYIFRLIAQKSAFASAKKMFRNLPSSPILSWKLHIVELAVLDANLSRYELAPTFMIKCVQATGKISNVHKHVLNGIPPILAVSSDGPTVATSHRF